jgi:hypothetical protein
MLELRFSQWCLCTVFWDITLCSPDTARPPSSGWKDIPSKKPAVVGLCPDCTASYPRTDHFFVKPQCSFCAVLDATGSYSSQFLWGNSYWLGSYTQCQQPHFDTQQEGSAPPFLGSYSVVNLRINVTGLTTPQARYISIHIHTELEPEVQLNQIVRIPQWGVTEKII